MAFKIGDIVTPRPAYIGSGYRFKVVAISGELFNHENDKYKLKRVEGDKLDIVYGPVSYQINKIERAEKLIWSGDELDDAYKYSPEPYGYGIARDAADSLAYATQVMGVPINQVNITGDSIQAHIPTPDKPQEIKSTVKLKYKNKNLFDGGICSEDTTLLGNPVYEYYKKLCNKEENIMDILDLYKTRKLGKIIAEYENKANEIYENDTIQSIIIEMENQVNALLEDKKDDARLHIKRRELITEETDNALADLDKELNKKKSELNATIDEVKALFEMTEDYNERIKILKKYEILNKDGKLSV